MQVDGLALAGPGRIWVLTEPYFPMSAWVLPDHIADVLPSEARHIEELRRVLLDAARRYGYELVMPPVLEHLESLLTGTGEALGLQTFKLVDQLSGRSMGLRADTTPQVARIDAHLLNRDGLTRLCYCGPVLHTRPEKPHATREPLQFGAELFGHRGLEADLEAMQLAYACLTAAGVDQVTLDLADVRILRCILRGVQVDSLTLDRLYAALASKDVGEIDRLTRSFPTDRRSALLLLPTLYGDVKVLDLASEALGFIDGVQAVLADLRWLVERMKGPAFLFDLADLRGYAYYSGVRFSMFVPDGVDALVRGGRYDEVGAVFGRNRPAVGFSLDLKELVGVVPSRELRPAIRAPWRDDCAELIEAVRALRDSGETVVSVLPGHESEVDEFLYDRELISVDGRWILSALK